MLCIDLPPSIWSLTADIIYTWNSHEAAALKERQPVSCFLKVQIKRHKALCSACGRDVQMMTKSADA